MTTINYFLFLKKKYENILKNLNEINEEYNEIILKTNGNGKIKYNDYLNIEINDCKSEIDKVNNALININKKIQDNCQHEFVNDYIDITPDLSKQIKYCTICEYTHED
jgi:hypothetical protein